MRGNLAPLLCLLLTACAAQETVEPSGEVGVRTLASGLQCGKGEKATIVELDSTEARQSALDSERVFVISMGLRPTAGHSLSLAQERARLEHGVVTIPVIWREPAPGVITAQVITRPCLIVALEKRRYAGVRVVDQGGVERAVWNK